MNQLFAHKWIKALAWLGLCICWIAGYFLNKNTQEQRISHYLEADDTPSEYIAPNIYCLKDANHASYLLIGEAKGYGGKIQVVIKTSTTGEIENVILDDHKETPSYLNKLISKKYLNQFEKLPLTDPNHFKTVNAISGATTSSTAIKNAVLQAAETYNVEVLQQESGQFKPAVHYQFGLAELTVVAILLMYFTVRVLRKISQKRMQRITTLISLILLGFMFNQSIGLSRLVALLSGWFPPLAINLAFYLLLGTTLVIIIWKKKISIVNGPVLLELFRIP